MVNATSWPLNPWEGDPVPIVWEAGWVPGPVRAGAEISPPPGFDPWTVQPVASHYTDYAIHAHIITSSECVHYNINVNKKKLN